MMEGESARRGEKRKKKGGIDLRFLSGLEMGFGGVGGSMRSMGGIRGRIFGKKVRLWDAGKEM